MLRGSLFLLALALPAHVLGDTEAVTDDGRRVVLRDDGTWAYAEAQAADEASPTDEAGRRVVHLTLERKKPRVNGCRLGLRLRNALGEEMRNVVPQVTAFLKDDTAYDTVFVGFQNINPTQSQYKEIGFSGITCDDIAYLKVGGADRCNMAGLTTYSSEKGECLAHIVVEPSALITISK
jgi:hypothetical protein